MEDPSNTDPNRVPSKPKKRPKKSLILRGVFQAATKIYACYRALNKLFEVLQDFMG